MKGAAPPEGCPPSSFPEPHAASQYQAARVLDSLSASVLYIHLLCLSLSKMYPEELEKPKSGDFWGLGK